MRDRVERRVILLKGVFIEEAKKVGFQVYFVHYSK